MRIALLNETSAADRNADIVAALAGRGFEVLNCGMKKNGESPELTYIHTGFLAALLVELKRVDLVVGGCGTGQGFLLSAMQYPGIYCGHILTPLDAFLFARINGGNCVSLALNQGYGWAANVNLSLIFDSLFSQESGSGYPEARKVSQAQSRTNLMRVSAAAHMGFADIVEALPEEIVRESLSYPGIRELIAAVPIEDTRLAGLLSKLTA